MISDVPLGALLSGGIDSSTVVALMQAQSQRPIKTFSVGYEETQYNEANHARAVARHLGTDHAELQVSSREALDLIPDLSRCYDEPFSDASQIPTMLLARFARERVTVCLTGDGGDELFGGYNRHIWAPQLWRIASRLPRVLRKGVASALLLWSPAQWDRLFELSSGWLPARLRQPRPGEKLHKMAGLLDARDMPELYALLTAAWRCPSRLVRDATELSSTIAPAPFRRHLDNIMYQDLMGYLPNDLLVKVDRASMAVSLEVRVPLLDPSLVSFAWRLPPKFKIRDGQGKWLLRRLLDRYVPRALVERPKMGFAVPIDQWLRGPIKEWAADLLDSTRLRNQGVLNPEPVTEKWNQHLAGKRDWQYQLWAVLMFQAWLDELPSIPALEE